MSISTEQYFARKPHTVEHAQAAADLLERVNNLLTEFQEASHCGPDIDPDTGTEISGAKNGNGDGGFRLTTATTGRALSAHKEGLAVDCSDQDNALDQWLDQFDDEKGGNSKLEEYGLYRENPSATMTWCHLQTRRPGSGRRTYFP